MKKDNDFLSRRYPYSAQTYKLAVKNLLSFNPGGVSFIIDQGNYDSDGENEF